MNKILVDGIWKNIGFNADVNAIIMSGLTTTAFSYCTLKRD